MVYNQSLIYLSIHIDFFLFIYTTNGVNLFISITVFFYIYICIFIYIFKFVHIYLLIYPCMFISLSILMSITKMYSVSISSCILSTSLSIYWFIYSDKSISICLIYPCVYNYISLFIHISPSI